MPRHTRVARDELANLLEALVRKGCVERIRTALVAQGQASRLSQAKSQIPNPRIVLRGFERIADRSGDAPVEARGEIRALFGDDERGVCLEGLGLEFRPFAIRVEDGRGLGAKGQPVLPVIVGTPARLPAKEAAIDPKAITVRFCRPLAGWEGFCLRFRLSPAGPCRFVAGDLTETRAAWGWPAEGEGGGGQGAGFAPPRRHRSGRSRGLAFAPLASGPQRLPSRPGRVTRPRARLVVSASSRWGETVGER